MNIGNAASASGVSAKMIRYYESIGLVRPASRSESGYRHFGDADIHALRFIRRARDLGFTVEQIKDLLGLWQDRSRRSVDVKQLATEHIAELRRKIEELESMVATLSHLAGHCHGDERPECPILEDLASTRGGTRSPLDQRFDVVRRPRQGNRAGHGKQG